MLRAIKSNETRLEYLGMSARRVLLIGYVISAFLGGIGGTLVSIIQQIATPEFGFWTKSGEFVFIAILGGGAHAFGAFAGAAMFECVRFYAAAHLADAWQLILGVVLIVIILYAPNGLIGLRQRDGQAKAGRALMANVLLSAKGHQDPVRRRDRRRRNQSRRPRGRKSRHHRTERRRQDDVPQHIDRLSPSAGRQRDLSRPGHHRATAAHDHQARHCPRLPNSAAVPRSDRDGEHADRSRLAARATRRAFKALSQHAGSAGDGAAAGSRRRQVIREAKGAGTARRATQARRYRARARA